MTTSNRAVYIVNIDGKQHRQPAENPYVPMHKIKKDIKKQFELDYDFDLFYKGSKILETSSLNENCFDDSTPLVVTRKDIRQMPTRVSEEEYKRPARPISLPRQTSLSTTIHKVLSLNNLYEEDIVDETESNINSAVPNEGYHWKPTIIYISPARSINEEEINFSLQTSINNPLSSRSKLPNLNGSIERIIDEQSRRVETPAFSSDVQPAYPNGLSMNADYQGTPRGRSRSAATKQTIVTFSVQRNSPNTSLTRKNVIDRVDSIEAKEKPLNIGNNRLRNDSSGPTSGYSSSSSSRSSSPGLSNFNLIVPTTNRDIPKRTGKSSYMNIDIQTLNENYSLELSYDATLKQLHRLMKQQLQQQNQLEKYSNRTHTILFFNFRMHIFKNLDIENEHINTFLSLKTNDNNPDFYVYALDRKLSENMYIYEKDPSKLFDNSLWWESHSEIEQLPLAQSTLLSTLYVLYQYFRRPTLNEKASRRALEIQFLLFLRKYLFPPAFQALKHLLIREIFLFEKTILIDGLLKLLSKFCPLSIDRNLLGIYTPHLFCWLFEQSCNEMETQDGFLKFDLIRYSSNINPHYINDPVTIHDLNHDRNILYEYHEAERYKNITRNIDLYSLIKYLQNSIDKKIYEIDTYTIDMRGNHSIKSIDRLNEKQISKLEEIMSRVYRSFTLLIRNVIENSDVRDQLILMNNKQVGICFKRRQRIKSDGKFDQDLQCFMPVDPSHSGIITLNSSDIFEVEHGRPDPYIPHSLRSNLPMKSKPIISFSPAEQITLILLDISDSMFKKRSDKRFIDLSINMLIMISKNLQRQSRSHAIGIILFGKDVITHCPITTNADDFEKAVYRIPKHGQPWTSMYDAINTGLDSIHQYESKHSVASDCEKLIICITDGINNRGTLTIDNLKQRLRRTIVVIDLIFFSSNATAAYSLQERQSITALRLLCAKSGGIVYRNSSTEPIDLVTTFEQEAVLWLKARKQRNNFGRGTVTSVDWPSAKEPEQLFQTAVHIRIPLKLMNDSHNRTDFIQRLYNEVNDVIRKQIENIQLYISSKKDRQMDYTFWKVILKVKKKKNSTILSYLRKCFCTPVINQELSHVIKIYFLRLHSVIIIFCFIIDWLNYLLLFIIN